MERFEVIVCNICGTQVAASKYPESMGDGGWHYTKDKYLDKRHYRLIILDEDELKLGTCHCKISKYPKLSAVRRQDLIEGLTKYFVEETDRFDDDAEEEVKVIMDFLDEFVWRKCTQGEIEF